MPASDLRRVRYCAHRNRRGWCTTCGKPRNPGNPAALRWARVLASVACEAYRRGHNIKVRARRRKRPPAWQREDESRCPRKPTVSLPTETAARPGRLFDALLSLPSSERTDHAGQEASRACVDQCGLRRHAHQQGVHQLAARGTQGGSCLRRSSSPPRALCSGRTGSRPASQFGKCRSLALGAFRTSRSAAGDQSRERSGGVPAASSSAM